jgi:hypothetical protein
MDEQLSEQTLIDQEPYYRSRSTLLVPKVYFDMFFWRSPYIKIDQWPLAGFLSMLMNDPQLDYKVSRLERTFKWKKQYQEAGQELVRVNFYPDDRDWGRLSAISNATGFSMCYIFVYLMLIALGVITLDDRGTQPSDQMRHWNPVVICCITVNAITRKLTRTLQT